LGSSAARTLARIIRQPLIVWSPMYSSASLPPSISILAYPTSSILNTKPQYSAQKIKHWPPVVIRRKCEELTFLFPPVIVTFTKRLVYVILFFARPLGVFFFSWGSTCDATLVSSQPTFLYQHPPRVSHQYTRRSAIREWRGEPTKRWTRTGFLCSRQKDLACVGVGMGCC